MRVLTATFLLLLLVGSSTLRGSELRTLPTTPFDRYGAILWEEEKAHLDNFAIHLQHDEKLLGYILVFDSAGGCPGEATARAMRAKRYLIEYRGIPWNRVMWRREGYTEGISTALLLAPAGVIVPYPFYDSTVAPVDGPSTRACKAKLQKIKRSR